MPLDMHCHYVPAALAAALRRRTEPPRIEANPAGGERLRLPVGFLAFAEETHCDIDARLAFMDEAGIDRQVLSFPGLFGLDSLPADECGALLAAFNDDLAALCRRHPTRFSGLAALPLADMERAVAEFRRAREALGLIGIILPVNGFVSERQAAYYAPLFAAAAALGGLVFVHPGRRPDEVPPPGARPTPYPFPDNVLARQALAVQDRVAAAMVTLLLSDFLGPWPEVPVQVANLGGTLAMVIERIDHAVALRDPAAAVAAERLRRVHVDCASLGPRSIEIAVATFGADRVVFGTDCPIFSTRRSLAAVAAARLADAERSALLDGNAKALIARAGG